MVSNKVMILNYVKICFNMSNGLYKADLDAKKKTSIF